MPPASLEALPDVGGDAHGDDEALLDVGAALAQRVVAAALPPKSWKDQRLRWIEPYWKGPALGAVIERAYELAS